MMAKQRLTISLAEEVLKQLEKQAEKMGLSKSSYLTTLILKQGEGKE